MLDLKKKVVLKIKIVEKHVLLNKLIKFFSFFLIKYTLAQKR